MTDDEFESFLKQCVAEFDGKQNRLKAARGLGGFASFWFDQNASSLGFRDASGSPRAIARVIVIGPHSVKANTWMWGWANSSLLPDLRAAAGRL